MLFMGRKILGKVSTCARLICSFPIALCIWIPNWTNKSNLLKRPHTITLDWRYVKTYMFSILNDIFNWWCMGYWHFMSRGKLLGITLWYIIFYYFCFTLMVSSQISHLLKKAEASIARKHYIDICITPFAPYIFYYPMVELFLSFCVKTDILLDITEKNRYNNWIHVYQYIVLSCLFVVVYFIYI